MNDSPQLFICINDYEISIIIGHIDKQNNIDLLEKFVLPNEDIIRNKISKLNIFTSLIKKNILLIEQKINYTFRDVIVILDNFEISFLNLCGFKKLNGTQISKENITYILNSLKSCVDKFEKNKKILHIFNSEYCLDKSKLDNLPIGLFGDFYSHELSFNMINENDYKNLKTIFDDCNIKIKKILPYGFLKGAIISNANSNVETFFHIQLNKNYCKIFYFKNDSFKFEQSFKFGTKLILQDISKVTSLNLETIDKLIKNNFNIHSIPDDELIEKEYFSNQNYRKIKKSLIKRIAEARIIEFFDIFFYKNPNCQNFLTDIKCFYIEIEDQKNLNCFKEIYTNYFYSKHKIHIKVIKKPDTKSLIDAAYKIAQFGWKKEAIPVTKESGSYFTRIFRSIFS